MEAISKLFYQPRPLPNRARLLDVGRTFLMPGEHVVIETAGERHRFNLYGITTEDLASKRWTVPGAIRVTVSGEEPADLIRKVRARFKLRLRQPRKSVTRQEVLRFIEVVRRRPQEFTRGSVNAQLDVWGRSALKHLRGIPIWDPLSTGYVSYAIRHIEDTFPGRGKSVSYDEAPVHRWSQFLRYSVKRFDPDFGAVGMTGWPLRTLSFSSISAYVSPAVELVADWRKEEFIEQAMQGLNHGGMMIAGSMMWPGMKRLRRGQRVDELMSVDDASGMQDINYHDPVRLSRKSNEHTTYFDDMTLIARSIQLLLDRKPFSLPHSTRPTWWKLRGDPMGKHGKMIATLHRFLRVDTGAIRLYTMDRWIGIEPELILMLSNEASFPRLANIWGVVVDGQDQDDARENHAMVENILRKFGKRTDRRGIE